MANAVDRAYSLIKGSIMSGELAGGERVKEELVAEKVGVSRTPIREALNKLAAEGFLALQPNHGARVIEWSERDLVEIIELRSVLESHGAGIAAERMGSDDLDRLDTLCREMEAAAARGSDSDMESLTALNSEFHMTIISASGNARLKDTIGSLAHPLLVQRRFSGFSQIGLQRSMNHHRELTTALRAGDSSWAAAVMRAHILASRHLV